MNANNVYDVTIQQIKICVLAAETGSFTTLANNLFMTSSAVCKQIRNIEERIGITIFTKGRGSNISLTPAGEILISKWSDLLKNYNISLINAEIEQQKKANVITVCAPASFNGDIFLIPAIREFMQAHPDSEIHVELLSPGRAKKKLANNTADIVISIAYRQSLFATDEYECIDIAKCNWYVGMRKENLLSARKNIEWQNLRNQKFVVVNDFMFIKSLTELCHNAGFDLQVGYANPTFSGIADNVLDNHSVFLCEPFLHDFNKDGFKYFELNNSPAGYVMVSKHSNINPMVKEFSKFLTLYTKKHGFNWN